MGGQRGDRSSSAKDVESSQKRGRALKTPRYLTVQNLAARSRLGWDDDNNNCCNCFRSHGGK